VPRHAAPTRRRPGDLLVRAGAAVFAAGVVAVWRSDAPLALDLLTLLLPLGFGLALLGLLRSARAHD
jgi:hypothetical protein